MSLTLAFGVEGAAHAGDYHLISKVDYGVVFIDAETIRTFDDRPRFWTTIFLFNDGGNGRAGSPSTAFVMTYDEVDCAQEQSRHRGLQSYDARGNPTDAVPTTSDWSPIVPESNEALTEKLVCDPAFLKADRSIVTGSLDLLARVRSSRNKFK